MGSRGSDYGSNSNWDVDFDHDTNCKEDDLMSQLRTETNHSKCASHSEGNFLENI